MKTENVKEELKKEVGDLDYFKIFERNYSVLSNNKIIDFIFNNNGVRKETIISNSPIIVGEVNGSPVERYNVKQKEDSQFLQYIYKISLGEKNVVATQTKASFDNISVDIVGTSHYSQGSKNIIREKFKNNNYDLCLIELDELRKKSLEDNNNGFSLKDFALTPLRHISKGNILRGILSLLPYSLASVIIGILKILKWPFEKITSMRDIEKGIDFKTALEESRKNQVRVALIDKDFVDVLKDYLSEATKKETITIITKFIASRVLMPFRRNRETKTVLKDIEKLKGEYPKLYRNLILKRDNYMSSKILENITGNENRILIVVGAGHVEGIKNSIEQHDFKEINSQIVENIL